MPTPPIISNLISFYKKPIIALVIALGLFVISDKATDFYQKRTETILELATENEVLIEQQKYIKKVMTDSIVFYKGERDRAIKMAVAQELSLKVKPNEKTMLKYYATMHDSTAYRLFISRYGKTTDLH